jgi:Zn-dependent protease
LNNVGSKPGLQIGRIIGIPIYLHSSWIIIFCLLTLALGTSFKQEHPTWSTAEGWSLGLLTSFLFFGSILFHELSHSVVAQHYKIRVLSITLFIFGGVAQIGKDPAKAIQEFNIAIAGPLASFLLYGVFQGLAWSFPANQGLGAVVTWLGMINVRLAVFNLIPGFPLDGGRILRAVVWSLNKSFLRATQIAAASGRIVAYAMILTGAWGAFNPDFSLTVGGSVIFAGGIGSLWLVFIGWFLLGAAQESVAQVAVRESLAGLTASDVMSQEIPSFPAHSTLEEYGAEVLRTGRRCHVILQDTRLVGLMNVHSLNSVPREEWPHNAVQSAMIPRDKILWTTPHEPLMRLLERLLKADINQMPVVSISPDGTAQIVGMVTRDSILRVMQTRTELGALESRQ